MIDKEKVYSLVRVFYNPGFKTFYINSTDGKSIVNNLGVFVSLGITTSKSTIQRVCDAINNSGNYKARIVEISSVNNGTEFVNCVTSNTDLSQYRTSELPEDEILDRSASLLELAKLRGEMKPDSPVELLSELAPRVSKLSYFVDELDKTNGWDSHSIQRLDGGKNYRVYHLYLNYKKVEDVEYRLGIYVEQKD